MEKKLLGMLMCVCLPVFAGEPPVVELGDYRVYGGRVANESPATGVATAVTALRYNPLVDVQARGPAERQADITVRGGIFENTGFRLGPLALPDPQTGHYFGEIPLDPAMLEGPEVLTGLGNALEGFNSTVATVRYGFAPVAATGSAEAGVGSHGLNYQRVRQGWVGPVGGGRREVGAEAGASRAEGHGTVARGDFAYERISGRVRVSGPEGTTDLFAGYSDEFYGWPGMYIGRAFGMLFPETDKFRIVLAGAAHRITYGDGSHAEAGLVFRQLTNEYQFNRDTPSDTFTHRTRMWSSGLRGRHAGGDWALDYHVTAVADELVYSRALTFGDFDSREYLKAAAVPSWRTALANGDIFEWRAGMVVDTSNKDATRGLPVAGVAWLHAANGAQWRAHLEYAAASQVPGYTALKSNPVGLFGGNADLGRETSRNLEAGLVYEAGAVTARGAVFRRDDRALVDWVFAEDEPTVRRAAPVDIDTHGLEAAVAVDHGAWRWMAGYMWLGKSEDYGDETVDASYYALNYARHRATLATVYRPLEALELRVDAELRRQASNILRGSGDTAFRMSAGISWAVNIGADLEVGAVADNLTKSDFETFPGVPAEGRQLSVFGRLRW